MNTLGFISALVAALAWPTAAVILGLIFREPIGALLRTAKRVKAAGIEFERGLAELQKEVAKIPEPTPDPRSTDLSWLSDTTKTLRDQVQAVAEIAPSAAISLAWTSVEKRLNEVTAKLLPDGERLAKRFPVNQVQALHERGVIDNATAAVLQQMRELRNRVSHTTGATADVSIAEARGYADVAATVIEYLGSLLRHWKAANPG